MSIKRTDKKAKIGEVSVLFLLFACLMYAGLSIWKTPAATILTIAMVITSLYAIWCGNDWDTIQKGMVSSIAGLLPAIIILLAVGMLIGTWMVSGIIPSMVYYGLQMLNPTYFLPTGALLCSLASVITGTSWGTISTIGVALLGVAQGFGISLPVAAGAVVVGCFFGDKVSPLSDTTNLAAGLAKANLFEHSRYLMFTTAPAWFLSILFFTFYGWNLPVSDQAVQNIALILSIIENHFFISPLLLIPPLLLLFLMTRRLPVIPVIMAGTAIACIIALIFQPGIQFTDLLSVFYKGFIAKTGNAMTDKLLSGGGMRSMNDTIVTAIIAMAFGGVLQASGIIFLVLNKLTGLIKTQFDLIITHSLATILILMLSGSIFVAMSVSAPIFSPLYDKLLLAKVNLSRTLEDSGTVVTPLIPWSIAALFIERVLGVPASEYAIYAPMCYLSLVFAYVYAYKGWLRKCMQTGMNA